MNTDGLLNLVHSSRKQERNIVWCTCWRCLYWGVCIRIYVSQSKCLGSCSGVAVNDWLCTHILSSCLLFIWGRNIYYWGKIHPLSPWVELPVISAGMPLAYMRVPFLLGEKVLAKSFKSGFLTELCITFLHSFPNVKDDSRQWYWQDLLTQMLLVV